MGVIKQLYPKSDAFQVWRQHIDQGCYEPLQVEITRMQDWSDQCQVEFKVGSLKVCSFYMPIDELHDMSMMFERAIEHTFTETVPADA